MQKLQYLPSTRFSCTKTKTSLQSSDEVLLYNMCVKVSLAGDIVSQTLCKAPQLNSLLRNHVNHVTFDQARSAYKESKQNPKIYLALTL